MNSVGKKGKIKYFFFTKSDIVERDNWEWILRIRNTDIQRGICTTTFSIVDCCFMAYQPS